MVIISPDKYQTFNDSYILLLSVLYLFILVFFLYRQSKTNKNWLRLDVIFLIGYTIVHFQIPFLASIGIEPSRPDFIWLNKLVVNYATWMSLFSISLWMFGYELIKNVSENDVYFKAPSYKVNNKKIDLILLVSFVFFLSTVGPSLFQGVYDGGMSWGSGANYMFLIFRTILYLRIIYFFSSLSKNFTLKVIFKKALQQKIFLVILTIYTFLFLLSGDRGPILYIALIIVGSYAIYIRPISLTKLVSFVLIGAFMFTLLRFGRGRDASEFEDSNIFKRGYSIYQENKDETNITNELASSVRIQYRALDIFPVSHPYLNGISFLTVGIGVIPFAGSFVVDYFNIPYQYQSSSRFFTYIGQGPNPTSGEGSELLADIYINFGLYGTFIIMFAFGMLSAFAVKKMKYGHSNYTILYIILVYSAISMNRGMLFTPLKDITYLLLFNYIFTRYFK